MIFQPAIIALLLASVVTATVAVVASGFGVQVLRHWDITSGSERQLALERLTYLISTLLGLAFAVALGSLLLFVLNADRMASQFVGAMCAVGTLNANAWGFPTLVLKIVNFFLAGTWLILNEVDTRGWDYPLIRAKYRYLLVITPFLIAEAVVQAVYFLGLEADVITSCCGSLFSTDAGTVAAEMSALPLVPSIIGFYTVLSATVVAGLVFIRWRRGGWVFAGLCALAFVVSIAAMISFISIYIYEHPHHHCPFCVIQGEHGYIGYALYLPLFAATVFGLGLFAMLPFKQIPSLRAVIPALAGRHATLSVALFAVFVAVATWSVATSNLVMRN